MTEAQQLISDWEYRRHRLLQRLSDYQQSFEDAAYEAVARPGAVTEQRARGAKIDILRLLEQIEFYDAAILAARRQALTPDWRAQWETITGVKA
jgi:hypothetical protein